MNTSHQDLDTRIYKSIYNNMKNKNLHCLIVFGLVSLLPCPISPLILSSNKVAHRLISRICKIWLTARISKEGQSYQCLSHAGFHLDVCSEVEEVVAAVLGCSVSTCRQPGGCSSVGNHTSARSENRTRVSLCPNYDCPLSFRLRHLTLLLPPAVSALSPAFLGHLN
jgi:hypothetical protein